MMNKYGIRLSAYHEDHHDWILSIPAKKQVFCDCLKCKRKRKNKKPQKQEISVAYKMLHMKELSKSLCTQKKKNFW